MIPLSDEGGSNHVKYVVCTTHRIGSELLCSLLVNTGLAGLPNERLERLRVKKAGIDWEKEDLREFIQKIFESSQTGNGVSGSKVHWNQIEHLVHLLNNTDRHEEVSVWNIESYFPPHTKYIYVTRRDKVRQAISLLKAEQTRIWKIQQGENNMVFYDLIFDLERMSECIIELKRQERSWKKFFKKNKIFPLKVVYEDYVKDFRGTVIKILQYLGIPIPEDPKIETDLLKQSDALSEEWVRKYYRMGLKRKISYLRKMCKSVVQETMQSFYQISAKFKKRYHFYDRFIKKLKILSSRARHAPFDYSSERNG